MKKTSQKILLCLINIFSCVILLLLSSCTLTSTPDNVQRNLSNLNLQFDLPGVTGQILGIEFCNLNAKSDDAYMKIQINWIDFSEYDRKTKREAENYYLGFNQNDRTYYKLVIPSSEDDKNTEVKLNNIKLNPYEDISVDLYKVNRGEYPIREYIIHLFSIPAE